MFIKAFKLTRKKIIYIFILLFACVSIGIFYTYANSENSENDNEEEQKDFIKWVDFNVTATAMDLTAKLDSLVSKIKNGETIENLTKALKYYDYYFESYSAVLGGFIGNYAIAPDFEQKYGVKAFLPISKNYSFNHYDDFGKSRSYGFKRNHLGNDLMGSIGTPIVAVESGVIENLGWNQYGGWRIGIRSFDSKRYYYYAHLRKDHPYAEGLESGMTVKAGDVIGYLGMTGYSIKENVNNINVPHLHFGMQLIFDESQVDGPNEIWIDVYQIVEFLKRNRSEVYMSNKETKDYSRKFDFMDENSFE